MGRGEGERNMWDPPAPRSWQDQVTEYIKDHRAGVTSSDDDEDDSPYDNSDDDTDDD